MIPKYCTLFNGSKWSKHHTDIIFIVFFRQHSDKQLPILCWKMVTYENRKIDWVQDSNVNIYNKKWQHKLDHLKKDENLTRQVKEDYSFGKVNHYMYKAVPWFLMECVDLDLKGQAQAIVRKEFKGGQTSHWSSMPCTSKVSSTLSL